MNALTEDICYALQALRFRDALLHAAELGANRDTFKQIELTLLAPNSYWSYWNVSDLDNLREAFGPLKNQINAGIKETKIESRIEIAILPLKRREVEL